MNNHQVERVNGKKRGVHIGIVERILGYSLRKGIEIHHVDGNGFNNVHTNLVVCPNRKYHFLLHARQRVYDACGHYDWRRCWICKLWDEDENLTRNCRSHQHKECATKRKHKLYG